MSAAFFGPGVRRALVGCALGCVSACGASPPETPADRGSEPPAATCSESFDIQSTAGVGYEDVATADVIAWPVDGVTFTTVATRDRSSTRVVGTLHNTSDAEQHVDFLTGGVMGLATNPFDVTFEGAPPRVAQGPEVYPAPRRAVLPAGATVTFTVVACPAAYPARAAWSFQPWSGGPVRGSVTVP